MLKHSNPFRLALTAFAFCSLVALGGSPAFAAEGANNQLVVADRAVPMTSELVRHISKYDEQTWWTDAQGANLGAVHRNSWKQWFRYHYVFRGVTGEKQSEATQPWGWGVFVTSMAELHIIDADAAVLVHLQGIYWTKAAKRFKLSDAENHYIGDAWVDTTGQSVAFSYPNRQSNRFASLIRENNGTGTGRWRLQVLDPDVIPADAWPIMGAYFSHDSDTVLAEQERSRVYRERVAEQERWDRLAEQSNRRTQSRY